MPYLFIIKMLIKHFLMIFTGPFQHLNRKQIALETPASKLFTPAGLWDDQKKEAQSFPGTIA
jgi:hypothetical protein